MKWHLKGTPYGVQLEAMRQSEGRDRFGYFLEMGLGKTALCLNDYIELMNQKEASRCVVICPMSLKSTWRDQAREWDEEGRITPVMWPNISRGADGTMLIMNYEAIIGSGGDYLEKFLNAKPDTLMILDESIHIKNPQAKRTKRLLQLCSRAKYVRLLSGAPMVKSPLDLWAQLRILRVNFNKGYENREPTYQLNPYAFRGRYCIMGGFRGKKIVGIQNEEHLRMLVNSVGFVAKKADWADLPEKLFTKREYVMGKKQFETYQDMRNDLITYIQDEEITAMMIITKLMKMQQISSGFAYTATGGAVRLDKNAKLDLLKEVVDEIDTKIIIFAHFKESLDIILETFGNRAVFLRGGMKAEEISEAKRSFNDGNADIIVCQSASAKYGHTLLGNEKKPCHTAIFYESDYNSDTRIQASDRLHRYGQIYPVTYIDFFGTELEEIIIEVLRYNQSISDIIVKELRNAA